MNLEDDLRRALRRTSAPTDFADRVLARIQDRGVAADTARPSRRVRALPWLAAAAAVVVLTTRGAQDYGDRRRLVEAERVKADIRFALQITSEKLTFVQRRVQDSYR